MFAIKRNKIVWKVPPFISQLNYMFPIFLQIWYLHIEPGASTLYTLLRQIGKLLTCVDGIGILGC